jgi:hypothetical protein
MILKLMNSKGSALILVVFAMLIAFFLGTALLEVSTIEFAMANNQVDGIKAYYIAEAGMNKAIASFMHDAELLQSLPDILKNVGDTMTLEIGEAFAGGNFSDVDVKLIERTDKYIIIELVASGTFNNAKRELVTQGQLNFDYNVKSQFMDSNTAIICVEQFSTSSSEIFVDGNIFSFGGIYLGWAFTGTGDVFGYADVTVYGKVTGDVFGTNNITTGSKAVINGSLTGRGTITIGDNNKIGGDVFASGKITTNWNPEIEGSVKSLAANETMTISGRDPGTTSKTVGGDVFSLGIISTGSDCKILGNVFGAKDVTIGYNAYVQQNVFSLKKIDGGYQGTIVNDAYGEIVNVGGAFNINMVNYVESTNYKGNKKKITSIPFPATPDPPEIKTFPGIPDVKVDDYKGQPGTKSITASNLDANHRLNLSTLTPGVYYVADNLTNLDVYGQYSGTISLVSQGKFAIYNDVTRTDLEKDALMLLSFSTADDAIYVNYQKTVEALLFAPVGGVQAVKDTIIMGGAMGKKVTIGNLGEVYHIESILNKFGLGNTGVKSFEIINWRQVSGMM